MKLVVAGSRTITNYDFIKEKLDEFRKTNSIDEIISGGARGVDTLACEYAIKNNIKFILFRADWNKYGKSAGYIRNDIMAKAGDELVAFHDGSSKGTVNMIERMTFQHKKVIIYRY